MDRTTKGFSSNHGSHKNSSTVSRLALGTTKPPTECVPGTNSPGIKQEEHEADHSPRTSAEIKRTWIIHSLFHTSAWDCA
jgi:hypothetical protein